MLVGTPGVRGSPGITGQKGEPGASGPPGPKGDRVRFELNENKNGLGA